MIWLYTEKKLNLNINQNIQIYEDCFDQRT